MELVAYDMFHPVPFETVENKPQKGLQEEVANYVRPSIRPGDAGVLASRPASDRQARDFPAKFWRGRLVSRAKSGRGRQARQFDSLDLLDLCTSHITHHLAMFVLSSTCKGHET